LGRALSRQSFGGVDRRRRAIEGGGFSPFDLPGVVTGWYQNATFSGAISSLPDLFNLSAPATQATGARQPTGNADGTMTFGGDDCLVAPFNANTISTTTQGFCFWMNLSGVTTAQNPFSLVGAAGGSTSRGRPEVGGVNGVGGIARTLGSIGGSNSTWAAGTLVANTWQFVCHEYDGGAALGSRMTLFIDGALVTPTADTSPSALTATSGTWTIGALDTSGTTGISGMLGRNFYVLNGKMSGATQGLLTSAARAALMALGR
jgi:hypothetical protein